MTRLASLLGRLRSSALALTGRSAAGRSRPRPLQRRRSLRWRRAFRGGVHVGGGGRRVSRRASTGAAVVITRPHVWGVRGHIWVGGYYPYYYRPTTRTTTRVRAVVLRRARTTRSSRATSAARASAARGRRRARAAEARHRPVRRRRQSTDSTRQTNTSRRHRRARPLPPDATGLLVEGELGKTSTSVNGVDNVRVDRRLGGSLIYEFGAYNRFAPYVLAGLGVQQANVDGDYNTTQDFGEIGVGLRYALTPQLPPHGRHPRGQPLDGVERQHRRRRPARAHGDARRRATAAHERGLHARAPRRDPLLLDRSSRSQRLAGGRATRRAAVCRFRVRSSATWFRVEQRQRRRARRHAHRLPGPRRRPGVVLANGLGGTYVAFKLPLRGARPATRSICWDYRGLYTSAAPTRSAREHDRRTRSTI